MDPCSTPPPTNNITPHQPATSLAASSLSFSAVLQDIFEQTRTEIQSAQNLAQHAHIASSFVATPPHHNQLAHCSILSSPPSAPTPRYEPLSDPALSYIYDILGEDDDIPAHLGALKDHPPFTYGELVAYKAKATEVAAILKEDSPSLTLNLSGLSPTRGPWKLPQAGGQYTALPLMSGVTHEGASFDSPHTTSRNIARTSSGNNFKAYFEPLPSIFKHVPILTPYSRPHLNHIVPNSYANGSGPSNVVSPNSFMPIKPIEFEYFEDQSINMGQSSHLLGMPHEPQTPNIIPGTHKPNPHRHDQHDDDDDDRQLHQHHQNKGINLLKLRKQSLTSHKRCSSTKKGRGGNKADCEHKYVDINDLLLQCAQTVGMNNTKSAMEILKRVKQHASPYGNGAQRLAYYFAEAMDARFAGTGWPLYMGSLSQRPSSADILKATCKYMESCPFAKASHYFINQTILNVAKGASKLHILELQTTGFQYPSLFKALAARPEGPPQVRLIAVGFPHYSMLPAQTDVVLEGLERSGAQLSECAASFNVPFQFTAWAGAREDLRMQDFVSPVRSSDEVLVVISAYLLRYVMDDTLDSPMARSKLLKMGRDVNPDVYIQGIVTGSYSTPFFTRRFREALFHFESVYDMLDTFIERENADRVVFESEILGKAILNIVACEGTDVVERVDKYKHWQAVTEEVGFEQLTLNEDIVDKVHVMLKSWHKEYTVAEDSQYLLMGWKGRMLHAMSTWKACLSPG